MVLIHVKEVETNGEGVGEGRVQKTIVKGMG
jgi:hypothetical protein